MKIPSARKAICMSLLSTFAAARGLQTNVRAFYSDWDHTLTVEELSAVTRNALCGSAYPDCAAASPDDPNALAMVTASL